MAKLDEKKQATQVAVVRSMQLHDSYQISMTWQTVDGIAQRSDLSKPSVNAAITLLLAKGYVEKRIQIRGRGPYRERWIQYRLTEVGTAVAV